MPYFIFSHYSDEPDHQKMLAYLQVSPLLHLNLRLGKGSGATLTYPLVASAINFLNNMASFTSVGICEKSTNAVIFYFTHFIYRQSIAVLLSMASTIYFSGAFHEDGLADSAVGLGCRWQRDQILTIMQDSRLETFVATALFLMFFASSKS